MQTFLPYPDFARSLAVLDYRRLGKQRVEARTILNILEGRTSGGSWAKHPAVLMWQGYEQALRLYLNLCITEWRSRGYVNRMARATVDQARLEMPWWLGRAEFHAAHRANLLRKDPDFYGRYGWAEQPATGYWWPPHQAEP